MALVAGVGALPSCHKGQSTRLCCRPGCASAPEGEVSTPSHRHWAKPGVGLCSETPFVDDGAGMHGLSLFSESHGPGPLCLTVLPPGNSRSQISARVHDILPNSMPALLLVCQPSTLPFALFISLVPGKERSLRAQARQNAECWNVQKR